MSDVSSIIIPVYNEEGVIAETLKKNVRAFERNYKDIKEIIVVDDGSIDNSKQEIENFIKNYKGNLDIRLIPHTTNMGKAQALNTGIMHAKGDYVLLSDSDSYMDGKTPRKVIRTMRKSGASCVVGHVVPAQNTLLTRLQKMEYDFDQKIIRTVQSVYTNVISIPGPLYFTKKNIVQNIKFDKYSIVEDFKIGIEMNMKEQRIEPTDAVVYSYSPTTIGQLRKQRLRWFGGILKESLSNTDVWKKNPFYMFNVVMCFASFFFTLATIALFGLMIYFATNPANLMVNFVIFFLLFCSGISILYAIAVKKLEADAFLLFPFYLTFLFLIRTEVVIKVVLNKDFKWGTREFKRE
ncbi:MAG: glycosyltransferase family 2 protein [Candidatus Aenigmarchaeota archaeon]|nr:glycosyltransferase family 2 protein [Candidatus Aenigmarchaeota archaeon]